MEKIELLLNGVSINKITDAIPHIDYLFKNFNILFNKFSKDRNGLREYSLRYNNIKKLFRIKKNGIVKKATI